MQRLIPLAAVLSLMLGGAPALAAPPQNAMPLSRLLQALEERVNPAYFEEIEWDNDGYWEIEYIDRNGGKQKLRVDPVTGQDRPRR